MSVSFSRCPLFTKHYRNLSCSATFAYVCAFWLGIANIPSALTTNGFDNNIQYLLYISDTFVITNFSWFIILAGIFNVLNSTCGMFVRTSFLIYVNSKCKLISVGLFHLCTWERTGQMNYVVNVLTDSIKMDIKEKALIVYADWK
jgi:hypothetical protein